MARPLPRSPGGGVGGQRVPWGAVWGRTHLEHLGLVDEPHERQEAPVGPAVDGHAAQVDEAVLLRHELQALHLVFDLHLALRRRPAPQWPPGRPRESTSALWGASPPGPPSQAPLTPTCSGGRGPGIWPLLYSATRLLGDSEKVTFPLRVSDYSFLKWGHPREQDPFYSGWEGGAC